MELVLVGYQFPHMAAAEYDSNWLTVRVRVHHPRGDWTAQDPSLLTYEAAQLADWLEAVADGNEADAECSFLEPNLRFELRIAPSGQRALRAFFDLEFRPAWATHDDAPEDDIFVDIPADPSQLTAAAVALREQLRVYPQRAAR